MRVFIQTDDKVKVSAPDFMAIGDPVRDMTVFGFAAYDALTGEDVDLIVEGDFNVEVESDGNKIGVGTDIYFDSLRKILTVFDPLDGYSRIGIAIANSDSEAQTQNVDIRLM